MLWDIKKVLGSQKMIDIVGNVEIVDIVDIVNSFIIVNIDDTC